MRYTPQITMVQEPRSAPVIFVKNLTDRVRWTFLAIIALYAYLAFHAFSGSQGILNWMNNDSQANRLEMKLESLIEKRSRMERRVKALSVEQLDIDAIDLLSREKLYYSHPKEFTIWLDPEE